MPFDVAELDKTTLLLLAVRDRLTAENWRPYAVDPGSAFDAGQGCLLQQLWRADNQRMESREYCEAVDRLKTVLAVPRGRDVGTFNDTHSLEEVQAAVDKAIGG